MTLALYRAYRPGTLAEVVGQDHVTQPLRRALATGRVHHAYLFSGPRGCGKTSTARIMARSLNCEQGPTPDPCGVCVSCVSLAPNGVGSPDVIELDAASHGGVDDTRELRERVIYSPAQSRYRIYIIDEAHMVSTQGFNALLKVIEEPPDYVRFIFATTEPDKVLGTIRSRTFNYAFRLVPVKTLSAHLASVCRSESVPFEPAALPLIAQAGGGSVRDALSIMDQLIAGSGEEGLSSGYVSTGLGLTDSVLLDRVVRATSERDGAAMFSAVDAVVESGHDIRRFLTDLLGRLRDLIMLQHLTDDQLGDLLHLPPDQIAVLRDQASAFGHAELSRAADLVSEGLSDVKGATAPRLQLELLLARLLLPAADDPATGVLPRLERVERAVDARAALGPNAGVDRPAAAARPPTPAAAPVEPAPAAAAAPSGAPADTKSAATRPGSAAPVKRATPPRRLSDLAPATAAKPRSAAPRQAPEPSTGPRAAEAPAPAPSAALNGNADLTRIRAGWPEVLTELGRRSRVAWAAWESSQPTSLTAGALTVAVSDKGRLSSIKASRRDELLRQVLIDVLRVDVTVAPVLAEAAPVADAERGAASLDDPDAESQVSGIDLAIREFGAVPIGEIGDA